MQKCISPIMIMYNILYRVVRVIIVITFYNMNTYSEFKNVMVCTIKLKCPQKDVSLVVSSTAGLIKTFQVKIK